uniref:NADH dehydrogenase [ubiquinone] iron-sulfur protein 4, mitochondrial n=1 Tax=Cyclophora tenuis TaxID=216820 RepID=A0A7S1D319_CYCTE
MLSVRPVFRLWSRTAAQRFLSSTESAVAIANAELEDGRSQLEAEKSAVQRKVEAMTKADPNMVFGSTEEDPDPELPENPAEITALDPAHLRDAIMPDGTQRLVHIQQRAYRVSQNPMDSEQTWYISFMDDGATAKTWDNPLMGWVSGADPMASNIQLQMSFRTASEAVYFAKKRGWHFVVDEPRFRRGRSDEVQYQDNFLPQKVAALVKRDRKQCNHWERPKAGASHYFRPLKYHGEGEVSQHGPNGDAPIAADAESYYKMR